MTVPTEKRNESDVIAVIAKEIKLRHKAPVIHIADNYSLVFVIFIKNFGQLKD
jgi:hypothetical protein